MILAFRKSYLKIFLLLLFVFWSIGIFYNTFIYLFPNLIFFHPFINKCYSLVCHQHNEKLINIFGLPLLVCARCSGIYFGLLISAVVNVFIRNKVLITNKILLLFSLPLIIDVIRNYLKIYDYSIIVAFISGLFFGAVLFFYFYNIILEFLQKYLTEK